MEKSNENNRLDWLIGAALFFGSLIYFLTYFDVGLNWMDEGWLTVPVDKILEGRLPYLDSYQFYTPGRWYLFAALFAALGKNLLITRIVWAVGHSLTALIAYSMSRKVMSRHLALVPALALILAPGPWHKTPFALGTVLGMYCVLVYSYEHTSIRKTVAVGLLIAAIFFFRQEPGGIFGAVIFLTIALNKEQRLKRLAIFATCAIVPTLIWITYLVARGAGPEMLRQVVFAGARGFAINPLPYPKIMDPLGAVGAIDTILAALGRAAFYAPMLIVGVFVRTWILKRREMDRAEAALYVASAAAFALSLNQLRARSDFAHLWQAYPAFCFMFALFAHRLSMAKPAVAKALAVAFLLMVGGGAFSSSDLFHGSARALEGRNVRLENSFARVKLTQAEHDVVSRVIDGIGRHSSPGENIFLAPDIPLFYSLTDRRNPTPWDTLRPGFLWGRADEEKAIRLLKEANVKLVVLRRPAIVPAGEKDVSETYPTLFGHIETDYALAESVGDFKFYLKR